MTNEENVLACKNMCNDFAANTQTQINLIATKQTAINQKLEEIENLKGGIWNTVLNERFEINNKLKWTNDLQRKIRFNEIAAENVDYQDALSALWTLEEELKIAQGEAEYQRKLFKSTELTMQFYAANPAG